MSESRLKPGDVVQLRSGGPKMTIQDIGLYDIAGTTYNALCVWFEGTKPMEKVYDLAVLKKLVVDDDSALSS